MEPDSLFARFENMRLYAGWRPEYAAVLRSAWAAVEPEMPALVEDFYHAIVRWPQTRAVLTGGPPQVDRLKATLRAWLGELFTAERDAAYVAQRWRVGRRHVEIGLQQAFASAAFSRLRAGLAEGLEKRWTGADDDLRAARRALHMALDLELALIDEAYAHEYHQKRHESERQQVELLLRHEKDFSESLFENAPAVVLLLDPQGCLARCNAHTEHLLGRPRAELRGLDWFGNFLPPHEAPRLRALFNNILVQGEATSTVNTIRTARGERLARWTNQLIRGPDGQPRFVLAIGQDITDLDEAQKRALQTERLAAIGQMVTGLTHESRNALQRIQACAEMLEIEVAGQPEAEHLVQRVQAAQHHIHQLFEEVRNYAAPLKLDRHDCRLREVWREAWELLHAQRRGRAAELVESPACETAAGLFDRFRLVQVFRNMFENSLAACHDPARIEVACEAAALADQPALRVRVRDNGPGLTAEQRAKIFQPFYTTKTKGTGLGMSIAQRIVEAHGGRVYVGESAGGAEIVLELPLRPPEGA